MCERNPLDREAKRRLAVIRHVEEVSGNVALTCRYLGFSRQAYYSFTGAIRPTELWELVGGGCWGRRDLDRYF